MSPEELNDDNRQAGAQLQRADAGPRKPMRGPHALEQLRQENEYLKNMQAHHMGAMSVPQGSTRMSLAQRALV